MTEIKNFVTIMKNTIDRILSVFNTAQERISYLEARSMETSETEIQRDKKERTEQSIQGMQSILKGVSLCNGNIRKKRKGEREVKFELIMVENFCKLITDTKTQISENHSRLNNKMSTPRHIIQYKL